MMESFIERENEIFEILDNFNKAKLRYVLVGGYAVSAYMHRFSVDADVCIEKRDLASFKNLLRIKHFKLKKRKDLEDVYNGEFECYTKKTELPVAVDLMIGSVASRQTNASISFARIYRNSVTKKITGIERTIITRIPIKEVLIALKIHSARLTDARDIVALCCNIDFERVAKFVHTGDSPKLRNNLDKLLMFLKSNDFKDSFKGVFSIEKLPTENIENAVKLIKSLKRY